VDVEFEEVEEGVVDEVDGAVDVFFYAEDKLQWPACFVTGWEWLDSLVGRLAGVLERFPPQYTHNVRELPVFGDVFARVSAPCQRPAWQYQCRIRTLSGSSRKRV